MANYNSKGIDYMREIGREGGAVSAFNRSKRPHAERTLIGIKAARARWGKPKWSEAEEKAYLQGWADCSKHYLRWPRTTGRTPDPRQPNNRSVPDTELLVVDSIAC
jgi:hypothetical protein